MDIHLQQKRKIKMIEMKLEKSPSPNEPDCVIIVVNNRDGTKTTKYYWQDRKFSMNINKDKQMIQPLEERNSK